MESLTEMRTSFLVLLVFVVGVLAAVAVAFKVTLGVIDAKAPTIPSGELDELFYAINIDNADILLKRNAALDSAKPAVFPMGYQSLVQPLSSRATNSLDGARQSALSELQSQPSVTEKTYASGGLEPSPALRSALDEADALYKEKVDKGVELAVDAYRQSLSDQAPFYLRYLGFLELGNTLDRDLFSYRELGSLNLNDAKLTIYRTETERNRQKVDDIRSEAETGVKAIEDDLEAQYTSKVDSLADSYVEKAESGMKKHPDSAGTDAIVSWVRDLLAEYRTPAFPAGEDLPSKPQLVTDTAAWVNKEKASAEKFGKISGVSKK